MSNSMMHIHDVARIEEERDQLENGVWITTVHFHLRDGGMLSITAFSENPLSVEDKQPLFPASVTEDAAA